VRGEAGVLIRYQVLGESEPWVEVLVVELHDLWSHNCFLAGQEDGRSRTPVINNGQDAVMALASRESHDEVHGYLFEGESVMGHCDFVQG